MRILFTIIIILSPLISVQGQTILKEDLTQNTIYSNAGISPSTLITVGYQRYFAKPVAKRQFILFTEVSSSLFAISLNDAEFKIGGIIPIYEYNKFKVINSLNFSYGRAETINFNSNKLAIADEIAFGRYGKKFFIAGTIEFEHVYLNYLKHSDYFRETYFSEVKDGWYKGLGGTFQVGIESGITLKKKVDLHLEIKVPFTQKLGNYSGSPFHVITGIRYHF